MSNSPVDWRRDWTRLSLLICEVRKSIPTESLLFPSSNLGWKYLPIICRTDIGLGWRERLTLPELLDKLVRISPIELSHFLREKGKALTIRKRLVFQLDDIYQERLVHVVAPSESSFINAYARFLQTLIRDKASGDREE